MHREALLRSIDETVRLSFSRSSGAGGQNVNKVSTRVSARLTISALEGLSESELLRLGARLRSRLTGDGELVVHASEHRSQRHNRTTAMERLRRIIFGALAEPKPRRPSAPSRASRRARLEAKRRQSSRKRLRRRIDPSSEE